jgi:hypothetical protein
VFELDERRRCEEATEHQRQQPGARIVRPLQQHRGGDDQKWQRIKRQQLLDDPADCRQQPAAGQPRTLERGRGQDERDGCAVALDLESGDVAGTDTPAQIEQQVVAIDLDAVDRDDPVAFLRPAFSAGPSGNTVATSIRAAAGRYRDSKPSVAGGGVRTRRIQAPL